MAALLAIAVVAGSALLWIGIPLGGLWVAGELTGRASTFLLVILLTVPTAMVAFGWVLYRVNGLYEEAHGGPTGPRPRAAWLVSSSERRPLGRRTLLDVSMTASATAALILLTVWFFFLAESPLAPLP
jgi:hypothetical protein